MRVSLQFKQSRNTAVNWVLETGQARAVPHFEEIPVRCDLNFVCEMAAVAGRTKKNPRSFPGSRSSTCPYAEILSRNRFVIGRHRRYVGATRHPSGPPRHLHPFISACSPGKIASCCAAGLRPQETATPCSSGTGMASYSVAPLHAAGRRSIRGGTPSGV